MLNQRFLGIVMRNGGKGKGIFQRECDYEATKELMRTIKNSRRKGGQQRINRGRRR